MNPVMFAIGNFEIRWYSFLILVGVFLGIAIAIREARRFSIGDDFMVNLCFYTVIFGIIGARLYYVLFNLDYYSQNLTEIYKIWNGGLAIHGGILAGAITILVYCRKHAKDPLRIIDIATASLILAQAIGRWGNFFNGEAHGTATSLIALEKMHIPEFIIKGMNINGIYYQPTFFYESIWCLLGFVLLMIIRYRKYLKVGEQTCIYFMWYSFGRFFIEGMRDDSLMLGGFKVAQLVSIALFIICTICFMIISRKGKFEDLYNEKKDVQTKYYS